MPPKTPLLSGPSRPGVFAIPSLAIVFLLPTSLLSAGNNEVPAQKSPFRDPPHSYWASPLNDPFAQLLKRTPQTGLSLDGPDEKTRLRNLLATLQVPESSQLLVYSATSLQSGLILPTNPRALYFNENIYVGYVPGGRIEIASIDPALGPIFYVSRTTSAPVLQFTRSERCMNCHAGRTSWQLPGMVAESVIATHSGASLDGFRREMVGHQIPLSERLGGWHVTGSGEHLSHLGNLMGEATPEGYRKFANPPGSRFNWAHYPNQNSDLLTHLIHEHQLGFHNLVTLATYRTREALVAGQGQIRPVDRETLQDIAHKLLRYILFADEAALPQGGLHSDSPFLKDFLSHRSATKNGLSLRDLDLKTRIFRHRCSYMVLTDSFQSLPKEFKDPFISRLTLALDPAVQTGEFAYLPPTEKQVILEILRESKVLL